jgi:ABC-type nickel/cobalt efflux system permease component RcnA
MVLLGAVVAAVVLAAAPAAPAAAHPLGNFSVNHYHGLHLFPDRVEDRAIIDDAEIPTLQQLPTVDTNADGVVSAAERAQYAGTTCLRVAAALRTDLDGRGLTWRVTRADFGYRTGAANLRTGRTECALHAPARVRGPATLSVTDGYQTDRVGWREITATGHGVGLDRPPVPAKSISDELRDYPNNLLASPLDQRSVRLRITEDGTGTGTAAGPRVPMAGGLARAMGTWGERLNTLVGSRLTPLAGLLGILLALLLGAAHAAMPGHGKTVMAAYIAGRQGTYRDAVIVGATVTATHTGGVLITGVLLTTVSSLAGETLLGWLGVASGVLIAAIGVGLLVSARAGRHERLRGRREELPSAAAGATLVAAGAHPHRSAHPHASHAHAHPHNHPHEHPHQPAVHDLPCGRHRHGAGRSPYRRGLIGMGVAGGLVPSPSALIILLGAIALGRTWLGVLLVLAYGLGMAATLTAAGLLLVHLRGRLAQRVGHVSGRLAAATPWITAALVLIVGVVLAAQAAGPLLSRGG